MQHNLRLRSQVAMAMREFLIHKHGMYESIHIMWQPHSQYMNVLQTAKAGQGVWERDYSTSNLQPKPTPVQITFHIASALYWKRYTCWVRSGDKTTGHLLHAESSRHTCYFQCLRLSSLERYATCIKAEPRPEMLNTRKGLKPSLVFFTLHVYSLSLSCPDRVCGSGDTHSLQENCRGNQ